MRTLIIHHLEPCWNDGYKRLGGTTFEKLTFEVMEHIESVNYDKVILTQFESTPLHGIEGYQPISHLVDTVHEYGYGWDASMFEDFDKNADEFQSEWGEIYCEGGNHSDLVLVADWMQELPKENVDICGAFDGECIEDLEIALTYLNINFNRINHLII